MKVSSMEHLPACPVCRHSDSSLLGQVADHSQTTLPAYSLHVCRSCGLQFINPRPREADVADYYPPAYHKLVPGNGRMSKRQKIALASWFGYPAANGTSPLFKLLQPFLKDKIGRQIPDFVDNGRLLEIGCGSGDYLVKMRDLGWQVWGVEVSPAAIAFASREYQLDVCLAPATSLPFGDDFFDVVFLKHVIEHLHRPLVAMCEIRRVLKPQGRVLITTPNTDSLGNRLFGPRWMAYDPPRHLMVYNKRSLARLFERSGLTLHSCRTPATNSQTVFRQSLSTVAQGGRRAFTRPLGHGYFALIWLLALCGLNLGEELQAVGVKA